VRSIAVSVVLLLCSCGERHPPAPSAQQNAQLNEAETMLNAMGNEEGPVDRSTGPSNESD